MTPAITTIVPQAGKKNRLSVLVDGEVWMNVHKATAKNLHLVLGEIDNLGRLGEEILRCEKICGFEQIAKFLSLRPRSEKEIHLRLSRYGYDQAVIKAIVKELAEKRIVGDFCFARWWVSEGMRIGKGRIRLRQELLSRGVPAEAIDSALHGQYSEEDDFSRALEIARRRFARLKKVDRNTAQSRMMGFIQRRGFSHGTAREVWQYLTVKDRGSG